MARYQQAAAEHQAADECNFDAQPCQRLRLCLVACTAPPTHARADGNPQRQRHHVAHGSQIGCNLVAGCSQRPLAGDKQSHQGEGSDFNQDRQPRRHPQTQKSTQTAPIRGFHALPQLQRSVELLAAHQNHRQDGNRVIHQQSGPGTAGSALGFNPPATKSEPDRQRHFQHQGADLQPRDQLGEPQCLVECGVEAEKHGRWQRPAHNHQVGAHIGLHAFRHFGPGQQGVRKDQHQHAQGRKAEGEVERLAERGAYRSGLPLAVLLCPDGQQGLQNAHE